MRLERARPTQHLREGLAFGQLAELAAMPLLVAVILLYHEQLRWSYLAAAIACVFVTLLYLALFMAVTGGKPDIDSQVMSAFILSCLTIATLGLLELGTSTPFGTFLPGCLVTVVFMSIIGNATMRIAIDCIAIATVVAVGWSAGLRADHLAAVVLVYASTVVIVTWLTSRTIGSLTQRVSFRRSVGVLNDALDEVGSGDTQTNTDLIQEIFRRGLPLVSDIMPAERIPVFARHGHLGRFLSLATWPDGEPDVCIDAGQLPELAQALATDAVVLGPEFCVVPIGYCSDGELAMVVRRTPHEHVDHRTTDAAEVLAAAFLRVTSRANFVSGLQTESRTDPLTGLANRRTLYERVQVEMEHALRSETPLSLAMIDLDHFKDYNDRHGHVAGDTLLRSIAALLVSNIRGQDLVVRYGGEEFCLIMPDTDILGGHHLLDNLRDGGREATSQFGVTLSAGLTSWDGVEDTTSMIERADQALYRAKQSGRNRVVSIQSVTEF
ncbi:MAG: diguanylate cyclase [Acidimicrobiales bacterium]